MDKLTSNQRPPECVKQCHIILISGIIDVAFLYKHIIKTNNYIMSGHVIQGAEL